jgi:uncharacterized protein YeaO (DUF488 family)
MELHLFTAQIGKYKGPDALDITVKSGDHAFAPTWDIVLDWKSGKINWETYTQRYRQKMLESYRQHSDTWNNILHKGDLTLLCYCREGEHCHRYLLAEFLCKLGEQVGVRVVNEGERPSNQKDKIESKENLSLASSHQIDLF